MVHQEQTGAELTRSLTNPADTGHGYRVAFQLAGYADMVAHEVHDLCFITDLLSVHLPVPNKDGIPPGVHTFLRAFLRFLIGSGVIPAARRIGNVAAHFSGGRRYHSKQNTEQEFAHVLE